MWVELFWLDLVRITDVSKKDKSTQINGLYYKFIINIW